MHVSSQRRRIFLTIAAPLVMLALAGPVVGQVVEVDEARIEQLKASAIAALKAPQGQQTLGQSAVVSLALLKADEPVTTPIIADTIRQILFGVKDNRYQPAVANNDIYEAGVCLMVLANADKVKYKPQIQVIAHHIVSRQTAVGAWDYPSGVSGDTSITQYAVLGLWEATRCGVEIPAGVWSKAARWHITTQYSHGGFTYHPAITNTPAGFIATPASEATHTMTVAGTASLYVCRLHLFPKAGALMLEPEPPPDGPAQKPPRTKPKYTILHPVAPDDPDDQLPRTAPGSGGAPVSVQRIGGDQTVTVALSAIDKAIEGGTKWLEDHWTISPQTGWSLYYLYGVERFAALSRKTDVKGQDWYAQGVQYLSTTHRPSGWSDGCGPGPATAFASMFLGKATAKMLKLAPRTRRSRVGSGVLIGGRGLPENLAQLELGKGEVTVRKMKGPVDELLAELEKAGEGAQVESAQASIVEQVVLENPEALIGQKERLTKLAVDKRAEVRRTAFWALGRSNDLTVVPLLINGLKDPDGNCTLEAHAALRYISRRIAEPDLPEQITPAIREQQVKQWTQWYLTVRPYVERNDLQPEPVIGPRPPSVVPKGRG